LEISEEVFAKNSNEGKFFQSQSSMETSMKEFSGLEKLIIEKMEAKVKE
jgi:hypothetical protein